MNAKCEYCGRWGIERKKCEGCGAWPELQLFDDSSWNKGKPKRRIMKPAPLNEISFVSTGNIISVYDRNANSPS